MSHPLRAPSTGAVAACAGLALALLLPGATSAAEPRTKPLTGAEVLAASTAADWRALDPANTLYLELPAGRVVIELAPQFAPHHVANVQALARGHYFDGLWIMRAQDNYVVQLADPDAEKPELARKSRRAQRTLPAEFETADVALIIGANDVVNPVARTDKSSPIYGMPILNADKAKNVIVIKRGKGAGFSGIENALFYLDNTRMLYGDGQKAAAELIQAIKAVE